MNLAMKDILLYLHSTCEYESQIKDSTNELWFRMPNEYWVVVTLLDLSCSLDKYGLVAEFVAPRLWMDPHTTDGGFTSNSKEDYEFAMWRAHRSIDIANAMGAKNIVLWLAREGTLCAESKDPDRKSVV